MHVRRACVRVRVRIGVRSRADETVTLIKVVECVGSEICVLEASRGGVAGVHCRGTTTTDTTAADSKSIRQHRGEWQLLRYRKRETWTRNLIQVLFYVYLILGLSLLNSIRVYFVCSFLFLLFLSYYLIVFF